MNYDIEYYENLLRRYSKTAEYINQIRWNWVKQLAPAIILDYGSGVGWFRAYRPNGAVVHTYDIGPYPQTGILRDHYDLITFWDVLEHLPDVLDIKPLLDHTDYIAGTIPVIKSGQEEKSWKHWKPGEHIVTWQEAQWRDMFWQLGWQVIESGYPECPPREDIWSFICRKFHS